MISAKFTIDLTRCTGCYACQIACKDRADLPDDLDWLQVRSDEGGAYPTPTLVYRVIHCFHCGDAPCAEVCPVEAIVEGDDEFIRVDAGLCIGCEACVDACPFGSMAMDPDGIASKCDGCASEVAQGWSPTCVCACPMRALDFGLPHEMAAKRRRHRDETFDDHVVRPAVVYLV